MRGAECIAVVVFCLLFQAGTSGAATECSINALLDSAAAPEVCYGRPALCDSLIGRIAMLAADTPDSLLDRLDTPWATYFDILNRALLELGDTARQAILAKLKATGGTAAALPLLAMLRETGRAGDEVPLDPALASGDPSLRVTACRCLAAFGSPLESWPRIAPLLDDSSAPVRLAAAWAVGEILRRERRLKPPGRIREGLKALLRDHCLPVRLTAWESLEAISPGKSGTVPTLITAGKSAIK